MDPDDHLSEPTARRRLEYRVAVIEEVLLGVAATVTGLLLAGGLLLRLVAQHDEETPVSINLLLSGFEPFTTQEVHLLPDSTFVGVCLLVLLAVTVAAFWALYAVGTGTVSERAVQVVDLVTGLVLVMALGVGAVALYLGSDEDLDLGAGPLLYIGGAVCLALLTWSGTRTWWDPVRSSGSA